MSANPLVKCSVDQCTHYMPGDQCMAAKISIYNNATAGQSSSPADTLCKAFHPRKTVGDIAGALHNSNIGGMVSAAFLNGTQVTPSVECFVSRCKHWQEDNLCTAAQIAVSGLNAALEQDTDCQTFEPK